VAITNSTVATNRGDFDGGGIVSFGGTVAITNSTIADNVTQDDRGGGIAGGLVTLQNTIVARNRQIPRGAPPQSGDCFGSITSLGNNLIGETMGCAITLQLSDLTGDSGLASFTDNGAPGKGHLPLLPTSRAIDSGNSAGCPPTDQLGQARVGRCDIGAIEFQPTDTVPPTITVFASPDTLWPPNGRMVPVTVSGTVMDIGGVNTSRVAFIVRDEYGQVQPNGNVVLQPNGNYSFIIELQSSQNGQDKNGRQYIIIVTAQDNAGNIGAASTGVSVPHSQGQ
jgi:hypothetical protein